MRADAALRSDLTRGHRATGFPRGRAPDSFLDRDGYEAVAEAVKLKLLMVRGPHLIEIRADGGVRLTPRCKLTDDEFTTRAVQPAYVGTYNRRALTEHIEDDLLHWMREQNAEVRQ